MSDIAALLYGFLCLLVIGFQICLIAGAPWGHLTQGGQHAGALPVAGRVGAALSIVLLAAMACAIWSAAGNAPYWPAWTGWTAIGIQTLSMVLNWITPSRAERQLWGPVTTVMLLLALLCAPELLAPS